MVNGGTNQSREAELERLRKYEDELRKRRETEEQRSQEAAFLRSSLRGSKKLQALESHPASDSVDGHVNPAYEKTPTSPPQEQRLSLHNDDDKVTSLEDVLLSVHRVSSALDQLPEHRRDADFLRHLFSQRDVHQAVGVTAAVQEHWSARRLPSPQATEAFALADSVLKLLSDSSSEQILELQDLLESPHLQAMLYSHDKIAHCIQESCPHASGEVWGLKETVLGTEHAGDLRIIRLFKDGDIPLGATVKAVNDSILIGRIVRGGVAERSGLLHEGDEVVEINGVRVTGRTVTEVCDILAGMAGMITFVILPSESTDLPDGGTKPPPVVKHMRALFDYDPEDDLYVPCRELGIGFNRGDVLHVISTEDTNWWQSYREGEDHPLAGLVPSASFQSQREQYNRELAREAEKEQLHNDGSFFCNWSKRNNESKKCKPFAPSEIGSTIDTDEILTYEEVSLYISRSGRKRPVVLVGPPNVGCLELRQRLMESDKERFAGVVPHTSRPRKPSEMDGVHYTFVSKADFQKDVADRKFVEWGEYQKHYYGTSKDSILNVMNKGRTCVLTLRAQSLRAVRNSGVMPYVVFISPPSLERLKLTRNKLQQVQLKDDDLKAIIQEARQTEDMFGHYFDKIIVNYDIDRTFQELRILIHRLETEPQWVPVAWLQNLDSSFRSQRVVL